MTEQFLGTALMIMSILVVFLAFPSQAYKNYKEKHFGISIILVLLGTCIYLLRIPYTFIRADWYILFPDLFGIAIHVVLLTQYFLYRKNKF